MYFVLGSRTLNSTDPNIRALRRKLEGRLMHLTGTEPANNAFIMRIGRRAHCGIQSQRQCNVYL